MKLKAEFSGLVMGVAIWMASSGCTLVASSESHKDRVVAPPSSSVAADANESSSFLDPRSLEETFFKEMGRRVDQGKITTPRQLFQQANDSAHCSVRVHTDHGSAMTPVDLYERVCHGVVVVGAIYWCPKCKMYHAECATGFVLREDGVIATNFHVLKAFEEKKAVGVMTADRRVFPVDTVLAGDEHNDFAVLKIKASGLEALPVAADVAVGATVYCVSHPNLDTNGKGNGFYMFSKGMVSGKYALMGDHHQPLDVLAVTCDYCKGSSGGPILNENGAVVGMVCQAVPLYYQAPEKDVQMIWRWSRPSSSLLKLLEP